MQICALQQIRKCETISALYLRSNMLIYNHSTLQMRNSFKVLLIYCTYMIPRQLNICKVQNGKSRENQRDLRQFRTAGYLNFQTGVRQNYTVWRPILWQREMQIWTEPGKIDSAHS